MLKIFTIQSLLKDDVPRIRTTSISGVCKIFQLYWKIIPTHCLRQCFNLLIKTLAFDLASSDVRAAVFNGLSFVAENEASHTVLKKLLPLVAVSIHDVTEKVRAAVVKLLHKLKKLKSIKYWDFVDMDNILARLSVEDSTKIQKSLVELTYNSFCPENTTTDNNLSVAERLSRIVFLLETNALAARHFFYYAHQFMANLEYGAETVLIMLRCVYGCVRTARHNNNSQTNDSTATTLNDVEELTDENEVPDALAAGATETDGKVITVENTDVVQGLLECSGILWKSLVPKLLMDENTEILKRLVKIASKIIQECFIFFVDERITETLLDMASLLKPSCIQYLSSSAFKKLKLMDDKDDVTQQVFGNLLKATCFWRFTEVAETVSVWLDKCGDLEQTSTGSVISATSRKRPRRIKFDPSSSKKLPTVAKPRLALKYLEFLVSNFECRLYIMKESKNRDLLVDICQKLDEFCSQHDAGLRIQINSPDNISWPELLLADRLQASIRFLLHPYSHKTKRTGNEALCFLKSKLSHHQSTTLEHLAENPHRDLAVSFLSQFFLTCRHAFMLSVADRDFVDQLCTFLSNFLNLNVHNLKLYTDVCQLCFNIADYLFNTDLPSKSYPTSSADNEMESLWPIVDRCCQKFIVLLDDGYKYSNEDKAYLCYSAEALRHVFQIFQGISGHQEIRALANKNLHSIKVALSADKKPENLV